MSECLPIETAPRGEVRFWGISGNAERVCYLRDYGQEYGAWVMFDPPLSGLDNTFRPTHWRAYD